MKKRKNATFKTKKYTKRELSDLILSVFRSNPVKNYNYKQLFRISGILNPAVKSTIISVLISLEKNGSIKEVKRGKYKLVEKTLTTSATVISLNQKGLFLKTEDFQEVFVDFEYSQFAFIGDLVTVLIFPKKRGRKKGEVLSVTKRIKDTFVGVLQSSSKYSFFIPDNRKVPFDIYIPNKFVKKDFLEKKLLVKVIDWSENQKNPTGKILSVIGDVKEHNTEINSILYDYDLAPDFSRDVIAASKSVPSNISKDDIKNRLDLRGVDTFTIDPDDAKDFDDALSVRCVGEKLWEIGVHIADVSHFVKEGGVLDREARKRSCSVYLVDRVIPMLPEIISNEICSLKPNEDRLCYSVLFVIDENANLTSVDFEKTIIHSNKRFTYSTAQDSIDKKRGVYHKQLLILDKIAKKLREVRVSSGALLFENSEVKFVLDKENNPISVFKKPVLSTNHLIEEFMLLANKSVSSFVAGQNKKTKAHSFIYRVHDEPVSDRIDSLSSLVKTFGYTIKRSSKKDLVSSLSSLQKKIQGKKEQFLLEKLIVRSMSKAIYSTKNIGHYGLGFSFYSHFTSPIRRYPDLIIHRLLERYLNNSPSRKEADLEEICKHSSEMEKRATMAERDSVKYMHVKYLKPSVGKCFDGVISGVTSWGLYVELNESRCEGLVKIKTLKGDYFVFDEQRFALKGHETNVVYQLGQSVRVKVKSVAFENRQLDFVIV
tara:strand:+ start:2067 stop:4202 length:2136 start_codon:yes stop_codon:yes gene_type:complete